MSVLRHIFSYLLEKFCGKHEVVKGLVRGVVYLRHIAYPLSVTLVYEYDVLSYTEHGVHVVGVYDCRDIVFVGYIAEQFINQNRC